MSAAWSRQVAIAAVLWGLCTAVAQADRLLVAGNEQALWLLHSRDEGRFDLVARPTGGTWQWIAPDRSGNAAAMTADGAALHVAFTSSQYLVFGLVSREGAPGLSLPAAPVALCSGRGLDDQVGSPVALVPATATTEPVNAPAPPEGATLEVLALVGGQWQRLTTVAHRGNLERVQATTWQGGLYLLAPQGNGQRNRLRLWKGGQWRDLALPPAMAQGQVLALESLDGRLTAVVAQPATGGQAETMRLEIATMDQPGGTFAFQPVTADGQEATWSATDSPAVSVLSDKLAIVWGPPRAPKLATLSPATGRLDPIEDVRIFEKPQADARPEQIREFFLWGLLILILIPLFVHRPGGVPKPFSLPQPLEPAPLARRLAAGLVDLLPFQLGAGAYLHFTLPMSAEAAMRMLIDLLRGRGPVPVQVAYAWAGTVVLFVLYSILMEMSLHATVGKLLFKLRVVGDEGADPRRLEVLLRNLFKAVEVFYFFPLLLVVLITRNRQRLGDMAARTAVIDARIPVPPSPPSQGQGGPRGSSDSAPPGE